MNSSRCLFRGGRPLFERLRTIALVLACYGASTAAPAQELPTVQLQLHWQHQAQFAGFYVARELGFYEREGIYVELVPGGPYVEPLSALALGAGDVAIGWLSGALATRQAGADIVNIAQIFKQPAAALVCWKAAGIRRPIDVKGKKIGVWNLGDQYNVTYWLRKNGLRQTDVELVPQNADAVDFKQQRVDCATVMTYNEYITILASGIPPSELFFVRFADEGSGLLEDGLYVRRATLLDRNKRDLLVRFLRASAAGWRYAERNREEAVTITLLYAPLADSARQRRMLDTVLQLIEPHQDFGLLSLTDFDRSIEIVVSGSENRSAVENAARQFWTHAIWYAANLGWRPRHLLTEAVSHSLMKAVDSTWFYVLTLVGTATFALSGFMRAQQRNYDVWGAFMLTMLTPASGGTLRDLLIGGANYPPFIIQQPIYLYVILMVFLIGGVLSRFLPASAPQSPRFVRIKTLSDAIGAATLAVVGAKVALLAGLAWYWVPISAAITISGGGMLTDIITGREPRTFQGEPYEEIAVMGGLFLLICLLIANRYEHAPWLVWAAILATMVLIFVVRILVVHYKIQSYRLGAVR
jgi:ABC-type nitrate/sulfonate/bicarbonate transport system substrate-binding protein/uncharacterized membrane protein YeiH